MEEDLEQQFFEDSDKKSLEPQVSQKAGWLTRLRAGVKEKAKFKLVALISFGSLIFLAIIVTVLEQVLPGKSSSQPVNEAYTPITIEPKPGQMVWLFFDDKNSNGVFDYQETVFKDISVTIRRTGDKTSLRTVPSDVQGLVTITDLAEGVYEVRFINYELEDQAVTDDFSWLNYYQLVKTGEERDEFLPSQWQRVNLNNQGFEAKVGVRLYQPESMLVLKTEKGLSLYDPERFKLVVKSNLSTEKKRQFVISNGNIFYLKPEKKALEKYSLKDKAATAVIEPVYEVETDKFRLSDNGLMLVYIEDKQIRYISNEAVCGEGAIFYDGERLEVKETDNRPLADFYGDRQLVFLGKGKETSWSLYVAECGEDKKMSVKKLKLETEPSSFGWLTDQTIFYSDSSGSYFYNIKGEEGLKYEALGSKAKVQISADNKYILAKVNGRQIIVDYPAVEASRVEKHYLLPFSGQIAISGDEVLVNQAKPCQPDGDCGEIIRISLKGNGVWEEKDRVELKDIQVEQVLGEVRL